MLSRTHWIDTLPFLAFLLTVPVACSGVDAEAQLVAQCPPVEVAEFAPVSKVLELRCGTLDCHGIAARPLRIYGQIGLRRPENEGSPNFPAGCAYDGYHTNSATCPTTDAEVIDNARAICGIEPEKTATVFAGKADPETLTLIRKARLLEKHKGGQIWVKNDPGDTCLTNWLTGKPLDPTICQEETSKD